MNRLEQAMIVGRRWPLDDFETFLVKHPLMTLIAQRLLWAGYDSKGKLTQLLRINGEQTCVDADNQPCSLAGLDSVGLPHPLHLDGQQKQTWGLAFADYEIMPPFPQLNREIHTLTPKEARATVSPDRGGGFPGCRCAGFWKATAGCATSTTTGGSRATTSRSTPPTGRPS
jgi:hypothetical protein